MQPEPEVGFGCAAVWAEHTVFGDNKNARSPMDCGRAKIARVLSSVVADGLDRAAFLCFLAPGFLFG